MNFDGQTKDTSPNGSRWGSAGFQDKDSSGESFCFVTVDSSESSEI
jgi:hypothetical protein